MAKGAPTPTLSQQASAQAAAELKASSQPILDEIAQERAAALQKARFVQGLSAAFSQLMGTLAPQVQQDYTSAANTQAGIAKGFSDAIQSKIGDSSNANNSFLTSLGAPAGAIKAAPDVGDVTFGMGGAIPAESMNQQGAAWTAYANMLPGDALLRGQQDATNALGSSNADILKLQNDLATLSGKGPETYRTIYNALVNQANQQWNQRFKVGQANEHIAEFNAKQTVSVARLNLDAQKFARTTLQQDRSYQVQLAHLGIAEKNQQLRALAQEYKLQNGGFTPFQVNKFKATGYNIARDGFNGYTDPKTKAVVPPKTYQQAMDTMQRNGVPMSIAQQELAAAGYAPGVRGTPYPNTPLTPAMRTAVGGAMKGIASDLQGVTGVKQYAYTEAARRYGWSNADLQALDQLWTRESGWSPTAKNPQSGALGIPQELGHKVPADYADNPQAQIDWGLNYIKQRYGSPSAAWAHELANGWY